MPERALNNNIEYIPLSKDSKEKEKELIFEKLEKKIAIIKHIKQLIDQTNAAEEISDVNKRFDEYFEEVFSQYPEAREKKEKIDILWEKAHTIHERLEVFSGKEENFSKEEEAEIENLKKAQDKLFAEMDVLKVDEEVCFLASLQNGMACLEEKFSSLREMEESDALLMAELEKALFFSIDDDEVGSRLDPRSIKHMAIDEFDVKVVFDKMYFTKQLAQKDKYVVGLHYAGTPFIAIRENANNIPLTVEHEKIHNILDGFFPKNNYDPSHLLKMYLENSSSAEEHSKQTIEQAIEKEKISTITPQALIDNLHEEMIADIDRVEAHLLNDGIVEFSTAEVEVDDMKKLLIAIERNSDDEDVKKHCLFLKEGIEKAFRRAARLMREALFISQNLGNEVEVHALLVLLKPSKWRHIKSYLASRHNTSVHEFSFKLKELQEKFNKNRVTKK